MRDGCMRGARLNKREGITIVADDASPVKRVSGRSLSGGTTRDKVFEHRLGSAWRSLGGANAYIRVGSVARSRSRGAQLGPKQDIDETTANHNLRHKGN